MLFPNLNPNTSKTERKVDRMKDFVMMDISEKKEKKGGRWFHCTCGLDHYAGYRVPLDDPIINHPEGCRRHKENE